MDKFLNKNEEQLFELLDQKEFEDLSKDEEMFVLSVSSEEEYRFQRSLISLSKEEELNEIRPFPLQIGKSENRSGKVVPLKFAFLAVAASVVLTFSVLKIFDNQIEQNDIVRTEYLTKYDTVYQETTITDTVFIPIEKKVFVKEEIVVNDGECFEIKEEPRLLETGPAQPINLDLSENKHGKSISKDNTTVLNFDFETNDITAFKK